MKTESLARAAILGIVGLLIPAVGGAQTLVDSDFSRGDFAGLGWQVNGAWEIVRYPAEAARNPGPVARFAANAPDGWLARSFTEVRNPGKLVLALDYGWGWGDVGQVSDAVAFMLLDARGNGYIFEIHRCKANWAVQWGRVVDGMPLKEKTWASEEIDARRKAVRDSGGLGRLVVTRDSGGLWTIADRDWNGGAGATVRFEDATTTSFSRLVLLGTRNFDEQVFNRVVLTVEGLTPTANTAIPASRFLDSIGINATFPDRGQPLPKTIEMIRYGGFRWVRGGIEGLTERGPTTLQTYLDLHRATGVRFSWGLVSGGTDVDRLLATARRIEAAGALLAFEGNNEPNNWGVTYKGEPGGGRSPSWLAVAKLQRDLYRAVKADPVLRKYPVWSISEGGAERDNVGLQFLTIPAGAGTLLPDGTKFADAANVHNYIYHPNSSGLADNKSWNAADPTSACKVDGLYGNYGVTWGGHFRGYSEAELLTLPRVTTETGCTIDGPVTEEIQALNLLSLYLDQFKRGWSHTAVYLLRDRTDEGGNQSFGFFRADYTPRKAAVYLHNLTTILADRGNLARPGRLSYVIPEQPPTVHELLLQKSDGTFYLVIWGERLKGTDDIDVRLGEAYPTLTIHDPTIGPEPIRTHHDLKSLRLTIGDRPLVVAIGRK